MSGVSIVFIVLALIGIVAAMGFYALGGFSLRGFSLRGDGHRNGAQGGSQGSRVENAPNSALDANSTNFMAQKEDVMWLFVGLGNPGKTYERNRHNVGFMVADALAEAYGTSPFRKKFNGLLADAVINGEKVALLKPDTFMNLSGQSVQPAMAFFKVTPDRVVVFYDELDLLPGKVRIKQGGGSGGHNGIKSIDQSLGNKDYWRVRIGIGHPGDKNRVSGYVLSDFDKADQAWLADLLPAMTRNAGKLLAPKGAEDFMNAIALATKDVTAMDKK